MIYFTIAYDEYGYIIDSISTDLNTLRKKFPNEKIYKSDRKINSIYVVKSSLHEI